MNEKLSDFYNVCSPVLLFLKRRGILLLSIILIFLSIFTIVGMRFISKELDKNRGEIAVHIKQELGFPITFENIKTGWHGLSLYVALSNVNVFDSEVPVAFVKIENIKIFPEIKTLLFNQAPQFKKIILQGLKIVAKWDPKEGFSILGLQGENIPNSIDYAILMASLSKQENVVIRSAEIDWRIPDRQIKHSWQGKFNWISAKKANWRLEGTQRFQMTEGLELPRSNFRLEASSILDKVTLSVEVENSVGECQLVSTNQNSQNVKHINCQGRIQEIEIAGLQQYYVPKSTDPEFLQWLSKALPTGVVSDGLFKVYGALDTLQWEGKFKFKNTEFHYAENWPELTEVRGFIEIENKKINAQLLEGKIMDWPIEEVSLNLAPAEKNQASVVYVKGFMYSTLETGLLFLQRTPQLASIARHLEPLHPEGSMHLTLNLMIPLKEEAVKVNGIVSTQAGFFEAPSLGIGLSQIQGNFHFTEQALTATNVKANLGEQPLELNIKTNLTPKRSIEINTKGEFNAEFFQEKFQLPKIFNGQSLFTLMFKTYLDSKIAEWVLSSDLKGMAIQLPLPFSKTPNASWLTTLAIELQPQKEQVRVALNVRDSLDAKLIINNLENSFKLEKGHLVLGKGVTDWIREDAFFIKGEVDNLDVQEWLDLLNKHKLNDLQQLPPLNINLLIQDLDIYGLHFNKTSIMTNAPLLNWAIEGPSIGGKINLSSVENDFTDIDLDYLNITYFNVNPKHKDNFLRGTKKSALNFHCKDLQYMGKQFGKTSFKLFPKQYGYDIQELNLKTSVSELEGNGEWHLEENKPYTFLQGEIYAANIEETFLNWGYPSAIRDASGYIKYQLRWSKSPFQFHIGAAEGIAELKLDKGRILGVDPGLGRIMGLLNLESIRRRLQLDFSDLFKQGFVFDSLKAKVNFKQGSAETEGFRIDGPSAKIELAGNANLEDKGIDFKMIVVPHTVGAGFPLAAAITGNPAIGAIGASVWVINKLTGKINQLTQHQYHVTGTWDEPAIQEIK